MIEEATPEEEARMLAPSDVERARADVAEFVAGEARVCRVVLDGADAARLQSLYVTYRRAARRAGVEARRDCGRIFLVRRRAGGGAE